MPEPSTSKPTSNADEAHDPKSRNMNESEKREQKQKQRITNKAADMYVHAAGAVAAVTGAMNEASLDGLEGTLDPSALPAWSSGGSESGLLEPPSLEGLDAAGVAAAKQAWGRGPLCAVFEQCVPLRARGALAQGEKVKALSAEVQWLLSLCQITQSLAVSPARRRFFLQDKEGQEVVMMDFEDPFASCPPSVPHGPDPRAQLVRQSLPDVTDEEVARVVAAYEAGAGPTEAELTAMREVGAPLLTLRYQHEFRGLPDSQRRIEAAFGAGGDGFVNPAAAAAHAKDQGVVVVQAESVDEVRAAAAVLRRHERLLSEGYRAAFATRCPCHAPIDAVAGQAGFRPSFLVPPTAVPEKPPAKVCANPACGKEELSGDGETAEGRPKHSTCAACKEVSYCSRECQKADWGAHKEGCQAAAARAAARAKKATQLAPSSSKGGKKKGARGKREKA